MTNAQGTCRWAAVMLAAISMILTSAIAAPAQMFITLHSFDNTDGALARAALLQGPDGALYGTTEGFGGTCVLLSCGTVFRITPGGGSLTTIYSFCRETGCPDGSGPVAPLVQSTGGALYGTTIEGGTYGQGTVFELTPTGTLNTIYSFCNLFDQCSGGDGPEGALIQAGDGSFYGTTYSGGANSYGTIFKITPTGILAILYDFCSQTGCTDGKNPYAGVVQGTDGSFYGTTYTGGTGVGCSTSSCGTIFKITPSGTFTTLHSFDSTDGANPFAGLVLASDGNFYGTTVFGGAQNGGTIFRMSPNGTLSTVYSFCSKTGCPDGENPEGGLVEATDGNLYGTTTWGGGNNVCQAGCGTLFQITPAGTLTTLHRFDSADGANPYAALVQDTNGNFYGTTYDGGASVACTGGCGTVFILSTGLGPFVKTLPTAAKVDASVIILGTKLTGATSVTFNGTPANFTIQSATAIKTTVPTGATTGPVQVATPSGTLTSNVNFQVLP